jgi:signal transduction histidine kinase
VHALARAIARALLLAAAWLAGPAVATVVSPQQAEIIVSSQTEPPAADDPRWRTVTLTHVERAPAAWYRVRFDADLADPAWMLYLPFLYGGGRISVNGVPVAQVTETSAELYISWERPVMLSLPQGALRAQGNELLVRVAAAHNSRSAMMSQPTLGPQIDLQPLFDRRLFAVRTMPVVTVIGGLTVGVLVLLIWVRRRREVLYGLFGLAAILWALRTTTFVFDALPAATWQVWGLLYFVSTGGFIVVMAIFTLALAGWSRPLVVRGLLGYWALGPLAYLLGGPAFAARWWVPGLIPIGLGLAALALLAAWRRRTPGTIAIAVALSLAFAAGVHDQLVASSSPLLSRWLPGWTDHRLFLLHHAANLLLLVMGTLLAMRFARTLSAVEAANRTLEARVQQREREIAASYERIAVLQREQAATDERQRIMRDLHDGLGSQLFTSLSRAERGALDATAMSDTLRSAIDQMRIAIEALASEEQDFRTAFGNFRFRWDARLRECGLRPVWQVELPDDVLAIAPHDALQILHIAQEALTNVLKHARARSVTVSLRHEGGVLALDVQDDGPGPPEGAALPAGGRGRSNMALRAERLGGTLELQLGPQGGRVSLRLPR